MCPEERSEETKRNGVLRHESARLESNSLLMRGLKPIGDYVRSLQSPRHWPWPSGRAFALISAATVVVFIGWYGFVYGVLKAAEPSLPYAADLYSLNRPEAFTFVDEKGEVIGHRGAIVGDRLTLSQMPPYVPAAFLAMEDRRFYQHHGIDPTSLMRALWVDLKARRLVQGGSTITQQLVKILFLTPDRTLARKLQEVAGAMELEHRLSKNQILELYLNRIYLGAGAYGVDGAARTYFGKSARALTLSEAAMLASLTSAPSAFSPRRDLKMAQQRADVVLSALFETHAMTERDVRDARKHPATLVAPQQALASDYFLDAAAEEAKNLAPGAMGDLVITTTIDRPMQEAARVSVANVLNKQGRGAQASQAALVAMAPDGAVKALIGGRDYAESPFNRAIKAHRQPGSAFKPFVYLAALEMGFTPATVRVDEPITIKDWSPENFADSYVGPVTLQDAMVNSINTIAVELGQEVGLQSVIAVARRLGITSPLEPNASLPLGTSEVTPLELTAAYAAFPTLGERVSPYMVRQIRSPNGTVLYQRAQDEPLRIVNEDNALAMNSMLFQAVQYGTGRAAQVPGREVAGKTGTSGGFRDAWFVGYAPNLIAGVWVGNDDFSPMKNVGGGALPAQIWTGFMRTALKGTPSQMLPRSAPVSSGAAIAAARPDNGEDFISRGFDGIRGFFRHLFNGDEPVRRRDDRGRQTYDNGRLRRDDYAEGRQDRYAYNRAAAPDQYAAPYSPFGERGYYERRRNEDDYRRSMERYRREYGYYGR